MKINKLSIIIPVYNERLYIAKTVNRVVRQKVNGIRKKEIIIVDDHSTDGTIKILKSMAKKYPAIKVVYKSKNEGKGSALKLGFIRSEGDVIIVQDGDLEYSPEDYNLLLEPFIKYDADVVYGSRFGIFKPHRVIYFWHYLINNLLTLVSNLFTNLNLSDMESGFKCFKGDLIRKIAVNLQSKKFGFEPEITAKISKVENVRFFEVGISYNGRNYREGKKINWADGVRAIWEIFKFNLFD